MRYLAVFLILFSTICHAEGEDPDPFYGNVIRYIYRNIDYGFSVGIPESMNGYVNFAPNPNHGVAIKLGDNRPVEVTSEHNGPLYSSAREDLQSDLKYFHAKRVKWSKVRLDGHPADRADFYSDGMHDVEIVRMRPRYNGDAFLETLYMQTDDAHYAEDIKTFDWVAASFHEIPIAPLTQADLDARRPPPE